MKQKSLLLLFLLFGLMAVLSPSLFAQQTYRIQPDVRNSSRKLIVVPKIVRTARKVVFERNLLAQLQYRRPAIPFKSFEMVHPRTGKPLNPDALLTIKLPNDSIRKTTVKEYFAQLNKMEKALNENGRTLRVPATFSDIQPAFTSQAYSRKPLWGNNLPGTVNIKALDINPEFYISFNGSWGNSEFPAEWVKQSTSFTTQNDLLFLVRMPAEYKSLITRIDWQVSDKPFGAAPDQLNPSSLKLSGTLSTLDWKGGVQGINVLPDYTKFIYHPVKINIWQIDKLPPQTKKEYYARAICYGIGQQSYVISEPVIIRYGQVENNIKIAIPKTEAAPPVATTFPSEVENAPFGIYVNSSGPRTTQYTKYIDNEYKTLVTSGESANAGISLGIRYFNFLNLVDSKAPKSGKLPLLEANFRAASGEVADYEKPTGAYLNLSVLGESLGAIRLDDNSNKGAVPFNYSLQSPTHELGLFDDWFIIGVVPVHIKSGIKADIGLDINGTYNAFENKVSATFTPRVNSWFYAFGGVDAVLAYATLNAEVNPLLKVGLPMTINGSTGKAAEMKMTLDALKGKVFLKVGFFYPCPSVSKVVGWIVGDEDVPFCECNWIYNIFDWPGLHEDYPK